MQWTIFLCVIAQCLAHTLMTNITINGKTQANCLRPAYPGSLWSTTGVGASDPIMQETTDGKWRGGVASTNYTCGFMPFAGNAAAAKCPVAAGSQVSVSFYHGAGYTGETPDKDMWIASSHKGPFMAFMAKYDGAGGLPTGNAWFKIYQLGKIAEATGGDWTTVKYASPDGLNANNGAMTFTIPADLAPGNYLLRTEIIALHSAGALYGAQPYVRCVELSVTGSGSANPPGVAIPGNWTAADPSMNYKLWNDYTKPYPFPGPAVYVARSVATSSTSSTTRSSTRATTSTSRSTSMTSQSTSRSASTTSRSTSQSSTSQPASTTDSGSNGTGSNDSTDEAVSGVSRVVATVSVIFALCLFL